MLNPVEIVNKLASFPNRAVASENEIKVLEFLSSLFPKERVSKESFKTPKTYISVVLWILCGLVLGLILSNLYPLLAFIITNYFVISAFFYFNWYASFITKLPPQVVSHNLIIKDKIPNKPKKLILMAHWDTAPISFLYRTEMVGNFRFSLNFSLILMGFSLIVVCLRFLIPNWDLSILTYISSIYFIIQGIIATMDYFRFGYSNGASDNATGVAAAIETANQLWGKKLDNVEIELVLTGAEEVGMIGARDYFLKNKKKFTKDTFLINFDTLGSGDLKVITQTGSLSNINYDNKIIQVSKDLIAQNADYQHITMGAWHTADFDSVWFQRAGMPCLTLAALDKKGRMPNIHRPTDTIENVDFKPMEDAIKLAVGIGIKINHYQ